jgi:general secretion pathway protein A
MYLPFFGLNKAPFSIPPDPHYLYMSERHREALAHLLFGMGNGGGFVLLTGEIGAGKTTVCRWFLEQVPVNCNVAYIFNPKLTVTELLQTICDEFHVKVGAVSTPPTVKDYFDPLNAFLLTEHSAGHSNVLIIDEAQNLSVDVLEQLRLLTNLETRERKLLQIILIGQPELRDMLARPELEQLSQRVITRFHLGALSLEETKLYVAHRMTVAGLTGPLPFDNDALKRLHQLTRGVPRRINLVCDRALLGAYGQGQTQVTPATIEQAAREVFGLRPADTGSRSALLARTALAVGGAVAGGALATWLWSQHEAQGRLETTPQAVAASAPARAMADTLAKDLAVAAASSPVAASGPAVAEAPAAASAPAAPLALQSASESAPARPLPPITWLRSEQAGLRLLAKAWGLDLRQTDVCEAAKASQLMCYRARLGLVQIRQLNRPGVVSLKAPGRAEPLYAVLTDLGNDSALLSTTDGTLELTLPELAEQWRGDYATFWRTPVGYAGVMSEGASGPAAHALAAGLAKLRGEKAPPDDARFDAALKARLQAFQATQGLELDGFAGPTTFMHLNRALGVAEPVLSAHRPAPSASAAR